MPCAVPSQPGSALAGRCPQPGHGDNEENFNILTMILPFNLNSTIAQVYIYKSLGVFAHINKRDGSGGRSGVKLLKHHQGATAEAVTGNAQLEGNGLGAGTAIGGGQQSNIHAQGRYSIASFRITMNFEGSGQRNITQRSVIKKKRNKNLSPRGLCSGAVYPNARGKHRGSQPGQKEALYIHRCVYIHIYIACVGMGIVICMDTVHL